MGGGPLSRRWRLLVSGPGPGAWNMALDEALAESVRAGGLPFLRFYTWQPHALSLGRFQHPYDGFQGAAASVPRVRRMTGGGGIWHADELTYSLGCTQEDLGIRGVKASFELLCGFLLDTWTSLGWEARFAKDGPASGTLGAYQPACFAGTEEYDILVGGRKLGGNAQKRDRQVIFQHGSIPRVVDHGMLAQLFGEDERPEPASITDLARCGWQGPAEALVPLLTRAFDQRVAHQGGGWEAENPTAEELRRAQDWERSRYSHADWTEGGTGSLRARF